MDRVLALIEWVVLGVEVVGVAVILIGAAISTVNYLSHVRQDTHGAYVGFRKQLAHSILLGLEFLVAADIIQTIAVHPTLESVGVLAIIVVIRTFLSLSLEMEVTGRWPWQRGEPSRGNAQRAT